MSSGPSSVLMSTLSPSLSNAAIENAEPAIACRCCTTPFAAAATAATALRCPALVDSDVHVLGATDDAPRVEGE